MYTEQTSLKSARMQLGNFSISLNVKDIAASKKFYEALGFSIIMGDEKQGWLILQNGTTNIGIFQGMFDSNLITFNPGWDHNGKPVSSFTDIRDIQAAIKAAGIEIPEEAQSGTEPAHFSIVDPDGNIILIDQHVAKAT